MTSDRSSDHPDAAGTGRDRLRVWVHGSGSLARHLWDGLARIGSGPDDGPNGGPNSGPGRIEVVAAPSATEPIDALVVAPWDKSEMAPRPFHELTDEEFDRAWQRTMDDAIAVSIAAREAFRAGGDGTGNIVFTFPTTALVGGAEYAHWAAAAEGIHILGKSMARQWGPEGVAVNAVAISPATVLADAERAGPISIAAPARPGADPVAAVAFLCSTAARDLAGQTITVDGGVWM